MNPMPNMLSRLACVSCAVVLAACQATITPAPSASAAGASPSAGANPSAEPSPTFSGPPLERGGASILDASFSELLPTPNGFLAVGTQGPNPVLAAGSPDGATWDSLTGSVVFGRAIDSVATGPRGWVAAQRIEVRGGAGVGTVLWYSPDGRTWLRLADQADVGISFPGSLVAGPWGFAMEGQWVDANGTSQPRVWLSRDGRSWQAMPLLDWQPDLVVVLDGAVLALGARNTALTTDGLAWVDGGLVPGNEYTGIGAAAALGSGVLAIVFGEHGPTVMRGTLDLRATPPLTWADAGVPLSPGTTNLTALASGALGAIVLGFNRQTLQPISWVSADGRAWRRADVPDVAFGGGVPSKVAVGKTAFVALSWHGNEGGDERARPSISSDGLTWSRTDTEALGVVPGPPSKACPSSNPTEAAQLIAMADGHRSIPQAMWPFCFQARQLVLRGYVGDCGGCGGVTDYVAEPTWLLEPLGYASFWLRGSPGTAGMGELTISVQINPKHPVKIPAAGAHVRITGHFDDPAAYDCRLIPSFSGVSELPPVGATIAGCRQQFVVTAVTVLPS
jgi:hypothetical protein